MRAVIHQELIPERVVPGKRLGRHLHWDNRNEQHPVRRATALTSRLWTRHVDIYDQGDLGCCTAAALCGCMSTGWWSHRFRTLYTVHRVYHQETVIDGFPGVWTPDDTGSSTLAAMKVAKTRGWATGYSWATTVDEVTTALQHGPAIIGVSWRDSFDHPSSNGLCSISAGATVRGGHELCLVGVDLTAKTVRFANSWSSSWGDHGYGVWTFDTLSTLLGEGGDCAQPEAT